jgi:hypothetical protein
MKTLYTMVGMRFRGTEAKVAALQNGDNLMLRREPTNRHDPNAVAIDSDLGIHLAYVKGTEAGNLARQMDAAGATQWPCTFRVTADRWPQVEVDSR